MATLNLRRIVVPLDGVERSALAELAERELRSPRDQIRSMLRQELQRHGLLESVDNAACDQPDQPQADRGE